MPLPDRIFTDVRRWLVSFLGEYYLQKFIPGDVEVIQLAEEGKLEVSYRWFRTYQDVEAFCFGLLRPDPPGPPKGLPFDI